MLTQLQSFAGTSLRTIERQDWSWFFRFDPPFVIATEAPWRLVTPQGVAVADEDHEQQFGLAEPIDAGTRVLTCLASREVHSVALDEHTGDLRLNFTENTYLEFFQMSCGYEAWRAHTNDGEVICTGGGAIAFVGLSNS